MCLHYNPQAPRSAHRRTTSALRTWDSDRRSRFSLSTSESRFEGGGWGHNSWDYDTCFILSTSKPSEEPRQRPQSQPVWLYETETPKGHYEVHLHSICVFLLWGVCHASLQRAWSKAVNPPLEAEMRGARAVGRGRTASRRPPVMRSARPALLHHGRESLSHVLQLEIHSPPESVWTLPSLFPWSVSTGTWKRNCMRARFFRSTKWLTCAHTGGRRWTGWAFLAEWGRVILAWNAQHYTRQDLWFAAQPETLPWGPSAVLSRSPFCWHGASLSGLGN